MYTCTVSELFARVDSDNVSDIIRNRLKISRSETEAVRHYYRDFIFLLRELTPRVSDMVIIAIFKPAVGAHIAPISSEDYTKLQLGQEPSGHCNIHTLVISPWQTALGMTVVCPMQVPDDHLAARIIMDMSYLGTTLEEWERNLRTYAWRASAITAMNDITPLSNDDIERVISFHRHCPWGTEDGLVNVHEIINEANKDTVFTVWRLISDVWGYWDMTGGQYAALCILLAHTTNCDDITVPLARILKYCNQEELIALLNEATQRYVWTGNVRKTTLFVQYTQSEKTLSVRLDPALRGLYDILRRNSRIMFDYYTHTYGETTLTEATRMETALFCVLAKNPTSQDRLTAEFPISQLFRNTPYEPEK